MIWFVPVALFLDFLLGDPSWLPHPVIAIGWLIEKLDNALYRPKRSPLIDRIFGVVVVLAVVLSCTAATWLTIYLAARIWAPLAWAISISTIGWTIAVKSLRQHSVKVADALRAHDIQAARKALAGIVGRDTRNLDEQEILRAAVETVAENSVDAVISPLFYALIGGAPLAVAYRAINTLDSMMGYKNDRYRYFGWAAARLDDAANYIPARLMLLVVPLAAWLVGLRGGAAWTIALRDAKKHSSPNSGIAEAAFAGALGVRLGGVNRYGRETRLVGFFGDDLLTLTPKSIRKANRLVMVMSILWATLGVALLWAVVSLAKI